jgi:hypothetical protein
MIGEPIYPCIFVSNSTTLTWKIPKISPENKLTFFTASIKVQQLIFVILLLICVSGLISPFLV